METVEVTIKIPEYMFEDIQDRYKHPNKGDGINLLEDAVATGKQLPKGHGRLIDADTYRKEMLDSREFDFFKRLDMQPTIIEADKEGE